MKIEQILEQVKLSKVSKLDGIMSWSLPAKTTCPGSKDASGETVASCKACYARRGRYLFGPAGKTREHNRKDWKRNDWVKDLVFALDNMRYFRWFDSGDIYHPVLAKKIYEVMKQTPWIRHWLPTLSYGVPKIKPWIDKMEQLPNVVVRKSSGSVCGEFDPKHKTSSTIVADERDIKGHSKVKVCSASQTGGQCAGCRACFDKDVKTIAYPLHTSGRRKK